MENYLKLFTRSDCRSEGVALGEEIGVPNDRGYSGGDLYNEPARDPFSGATEPLLFRRGISGSHLVLHLLHGKHVCNVPWL